MGKIKQGILGGFRGKVGTVIGASWNGISYMRGLAQSHKNPKTAAQTTQRSFFKEVLDIASQFSDEQIKFLFPENVGGMTRHNALVKQLTDTGNKAVAAGIAVGVAAAAGAIGMGIAIAKSAESMARQPEAAGKINSAMMLGLVFIETTIIYALIVAILIIFVL